MKKYDLRELQRQKWNTDPGLKMAWDDEIVKILIGGVMKSPKDKYMNDPEYHHLVNTLESFIHQAKFTPSELREACVLASINYEMKHVRDMHIDPRVTKAFEVLDNFTSRRPR